MSGIEIAGLALGAVPLILAAIKGYGEVCEKIQTFKHTESQLRLLDARFRVCKVNFQSECEALLNLVLSDPQLSKKMLANPDHDSWQDENTEERLTNLLEENLDVCITIIADTHAVILEFLARLSKLQTPSTTGTGSFQRARTSATLMMEKSRFERDISTLRQRNADLSLLRKSLDRVEHLPRDNSASGNARMAVGRLSKIQVACGLLHDTFKDAWSCSDQSHARHWVKLCIDSEPEPKFDPVTLDMAISSEIIAVPQCKRINNATIWMYVRSESTPSQTTGEQQVSQKSFQNLVKAIQQTPQPVSMVPDSIAAPGPSKATVPVSITALASDGVDICKVACMCSYFQQNVRAFCGQHGPRCLGYLKSTSDSRYLFYPPVAPTAVSTGQSNTAEEVTTLISLIEQSKRGPFELLHQYQLALKISKSVLQFHSTPWLPPIWKLQDVSIFGSELSERTLKTLHLSVCFESAPSTLLENQPPNNASAEITKDSRASSSVDACYKRICPGIYNQTLFSLGIALLEISHWQNFRKMSQSDTDEFYAAHRLVRGPAPLGSKFRKIVERCLRCEFDAGSEDLKDFDLQHAVWSKVIYPLEALIRDTSSAV
jgi:hypothetical protein